MREDRTLPHGPHFGLHAQASSERDGEARFCVAIADAKLEGLLGRFETFNAIGVVLVSDRVLHKIVNRSRHAPPVVGRKRSN
jgi:hypothetical protein